MTSPTFTLRSLRHPALAPAVAALVIGGLTGRGATTSAAGQPAPTTSRPGTLHAGTSHAPHVVTAPALRMVTTHGHRLAFHVIPGHQPAIVLDAGGGLDSS